MSVILHRKAAFKEHSPNSFSSLRWDHEFHRSSEHVGRKPCSQLDGRFLDSSCRCHKMLEIRILQQTEVIHAMQTEEQCDIFGCLLYSRDRENRDI